MTTRLSVTNTQTNSLATVITEVKYIRSVDNSGWLLVKLNTNGAIVSLCEYTKVIILKRSAERIYFLIQEGEYAQETASLNNKYTSKCLVSYKRGTGARLNVKITGRKRENSLIREQHFKSRQEFNQLFAELTFQNIKARITLDSDVNYFETNRNSPAYNQIKHSKPLPKGTYKIMIPDSPKKASMTEFYRTYGFRELHYDTVWFPIEYAPTHNSNFVHVGHLSEGCVTCYEIQKWNALYQYLITNRTADGKYVGALVIS